MKRGWDFSKMAVIEGDGELLLEMGGSQEWGRGGWFYNGGDGKCLKSSYIVGERMLSPLFYADLPISPTTTSPFSNFIEPLPSPLPPPPLTSLSPPTPIPTDFSIFLFLWLNRWSCHIWMHLHMSSLGTLVPEGPWCMFYATRHKFAEVWHIMCFYCTLIWYHTQTDKYKQHT